MARGKIFSTARLDDYSERVLGEFGELVFASDTRAGADRADRQFYRFRGPRRNATGPSGGHQPLASAEGDRPHRRRLRQRRHCCRHGTQDSLIYTLGAGSRAVAEAAITFMLALCTMLPFWDRQLKTGNWKSRLEVQGRDLDGHTLGIIGLGRICQLLAEMARPFNMNVIAYDPFVPQEQAAAVGVRIVELDELFRTSDFVSIHCPPTSEDKGLINRETLARMKRGSYLVNLSRGSLVESLDALDEALESGRLAGVGLDVFDPAHPDVTHPIFKRENCLTSPHSMATTEGALTRIFKSMADDMAAVLRGERPKHVVNPEVFE